MGNGLRKITACFNGRGKKRGSVPASKLVVLDDGLCLGHSFCYVRPKSAFVASSKVHSEESTTFRSISGASISANTSTPLSTLLIHPCSGDSADPAAAFESSTSFAALPLLPIPKSHMRFSVSDPALSHDSGSFERGFLSGPIERGFMSGPIDQGIFSGPFEEGNFKKFRRSLSHEGTVFQQTLKKKSLIRSFRRVISKNFQLRHHDHHDRELESNDNSVKPDNLTARISSVHASSDGSVENVYALENQNLQWAQGKAGEDRVHVVVSEEHGWVFVGIYDGFNGPDAPDYLLSNLYSFLHKELKVLLWDDKDALHEQNHANETDTHVELEEESQKRRHENVLNALSKALHETEESYLGIADEMLGENPELALMGSCVLVMLMKEEDVYVMNLGDSRAVLAQNLESSVHAKHDLESSVHEKTNSISYLVACQLSVDHSTSLDEEVKRIRDEHPDDAFAVMNGRVKGSLKVTRAFGAGFLKQPKWNEAILEMFRIDYIGNSPYLSCIPYLYHHQLSAKDRFLILSSDGLYQYFTNEEAVKEVGHFMSLQPEGDPAQHLVEEALFRAAKKAGIEFHDLLEIPQGERRRYHDDISIIIISFEGRIWKSCVLC